MNRFLAIAVLALAFSPPAHARQAAPAPAPPPAAADPATLVFKAWDSNGDGRLSRAEFQGGWEHAQALAGAKAALARRFAAIDANRDRAIDVGEYGNLLLLKGAGEAAPPLARFDADRNGKLEFIEYARLVGTLAPRHAARKEAGP